MTGGAGVEQERQALALMDRPIIARVYDAGLADPDRAARPFVVMEFIPGVPITDYCDTMKLSARQRLELFLPVCQAIQHAHHTLMIWNNHFPGLEGELTMLVPTSIYRERISPCLIRCTQMDQSHPESSDACRARLDPESLRAECIAKSLPFVDLGSPSVAGGGLVNGFRPRHPRITSGRPNGPHTRRATAAATSTSRTSSAATAHGWGTTRNSTARYNHCGTGMTSCSTSRRAT